MRRPGITLLEVLTAIFIMGIGMLAILTLFPLGALSMARAVRDDRGATIAANAAALARAFDLASDPNVQAALNATPTGFLAPQPTTPSYPVLVDPFGDTLAPNGAVGAVANVTPGVRRIP